MFPVYRANWPTFPACVGGGGKLEPVGLLYCTTAWLARRCGGRDVAEAGGGDRPHTTGNILKY